MKLRKAIGFFLFFTSLYFFSGAIPGGNDAAGTQKTQGGTDTLLCLDFQNQQLPAAWTNLDEDSLSDVQNRPANWHIRFEELSTLPGDTNWVAASNSWFSPAGRADNWLISDSLYLNDSTYFLEWKSAPFEGPVFMDGYQVLLSTTGNHPDSFNVVLADFAEGIDATSNPGPGEVHSSYLGNRGRLQAWQTSLAAWDSMSVWIAFRHNSENDNLIQLDDIIIRKVSPWEVALRQGDYDSPYATVPLSQTRPMAFEATVANEGFDTLPRVWATAEVRLNSAPVFSGSDTLMELAGFSDTLFSLPGTFTPPVTGTYDIRYSAGTDSNDVFAGNNTASMQFFVNDSVYARDRNSFPESWSLPADGGWIGNTYQLFFRDTLTSMAVYIADPQGIDSLHGAVFAVGTQPGQIQARTVPVPVNGAGWYVLDIMGADYIMEPGTWLIAVFEDAGEELGLGLSVDRYVEGGSWIQLQGVWGPGELQGLRRVPGIRAHFGVPRQFIGVAPPVAGARIGIGPNPSNGTVRLTGLPENAGPLNWTLFDLQGRALKRGKIDAGSATWPLNLEGLPSGTWHLRVEQAGNILQTLPLIIKH